MAFQVGNRVRHSHHVVMRKRDYWNSCGDYARKQAAKDALDKCIAERGTITALLIGDPSRGVSPGIEVVWDNGSISRCLDYMVSAAE